MCVILDGFAAPCATPGTLARRKRIRHALCADGANNQYLVASFDGAAGIEAVPKEQGEAARSLGMNEKQAMFQIILPQALRTIIPAIGNQTLGMLKDTSLVSVLAISDILRVGNEYATKHFNYFETYTYVALTYLLLTLLLSRLVQNLENRFRPA